jgi:hypothetical protein
VTNDELKVADLRRGIDQMFDYRSGWHPKPAPALAAPGDGVDWAAPDISVR